MQTLYVDVYFLINFTVDLLALYFAAALSKAPTSAVRISVSAAVGALGAVLIILLPEMPLLKMLCSFLSVLLMAFIGTKKIRLVRRMKFTFAFFIFSALVGGATYYAWGIFDKFLYGKITEEGGVTNRKMLFFSMIVLFSIGVFKMIVSFFSHTQCEGSAEVEISFGEKTLRAEAFIDSGNLAIDPMDMRPVLFIKTGVAEDVFPENVVHLGDPDVLPRDVRRRIRLIPISRGGATHVLTGIKADKVCIIKNGRCEQISVTVAIDKEDGDYGGYDILLPSSVVCDVISK